MLISHENNQVKTNIEKIFIEKATEFDENELFELIRELEDAAFYLDIDRIIILVEKLVPTYKRTANENEISNNYV